LQYFLSSYSSCRYDRKRLAETEKHAREEHDDYLGVTRTHHHRMRICIDGSRVRDFHQHACFWEVHEADIKRD